MPITYDENGSRFVLTDADCARINQQIAEWTEQRPIACAIAEHCSRLHRQASSLPDDAPERKRLKQRIRKLMSYFGQGLYCNSESEQDELIRGFAESLTTGVLRRNGERIRTWKEIKCLADEFSEHVKTRPRGRPVEYRHHVTEALEMKCKHSDWSWKRILQELELTIPRADLTRQITALKTLLRKENISLPAQR